MIKVSTAIAKKDEGQNESGEVKNNLSAAHQIWKKFLELLEDNLKPSEVSTWFSAIEPLEFENNTLTISVPSKDYYGIIEKRYNKQINSIIESGLLGEEGKLIYKVAQFDLFEDKQTTEAETTDRKILPLPLRSKRTDEKETGHEENRFDSNLYPKNTFENFVRGESNELAVAAAWAITNNPGKIYNPLFIYGGVGLGKTHLVQAIGNEIKKKHPEKKIYYTTAPDFTKQFTDSIANNRISDFSTNLFGTKKLESFYKSLDVLILDDVQNLSGKEKTQDFMYQIFNTLFNEKKHIIFSSDKPINTIKGIEERLVSRFQWGMTADIQPPNWEMRVVIIQRKFEESGVDVPEDIIHYIATNVKDSIRTIEGCIVGMIAESALIYKGEITFEIAEKVINRVVGGVNRSKNVSIENIIQVVAQEYNVSENLILSRKRTKEIAFARQVAMYLAKDMTNLTLQSIGLNFGGKDHATVLYAFSSVSKSLVKDDDLRKRVVYLKDKIKNL